MLVAKVNDSRARVTPKRALCHIGQSWWGPHRRRSGPHRNRNSLWEIKPLIHARGVVPLRC
jgi:hypothetical protein